jgi:hypothetical protein
MFRASPALVRRIHNTQRFRSSVNRATRDSTAEALDYAKRPAQSDRNRSHRH